MGNLLMAKDLIATWGFGFSGGSPPLPIENAPPEIKTISGVSGAAIGTGAGAAGTVLSLAASRGLCAGAGAGGFSIGSGARAGNGGGALAPTAGGSDFSAAVGA